MKIRKLIVLCMMVSALSGIPALGTLEVESIVIGNKTMEEEKLYMQDETEAEESPINVIITEESKTASNEANVNIEYSFEKSLMDEEVEELFLRNSRKISEEINNSVKRTVRISREEYQLINDFTETFLKTYLSREAPDFSIYYDQSNKIREENRLLIELYIYELAIIKDNTVESFDRELNITKVASVTEGVNEVVFYLVQKLHTDEGQECGGKWFIANIIQTESEYKFLNIWVEDHEYEMMQSHLKNDYLKKNIPLKKEQLTKDILYLIK